MPGSRTRPTAAGVDRKRAPQKPASPPDLVGARIREMGGWQAETLSRLRALIRQADPAVVEDVKWKKPTNPGGVPVWYHDGIICTGEAYKNHVRVTFAKGAALNDAKGVLNASLKGNAFRAIVIGQDERINETAFKALVRSAVALNASRRR